MKTQNLSSFPKSLSIKYPLVRAYKGDCMTVWQELPSGEVFFFDYLPCNSPMFETGLIDNIKKAYARFKELEGEGWEIEEERFSEDYAEEI